MGKDNAGRIGHLISEIQTTIKTDPIAAAKLCRSVLKDADEGYRKELYKILALIYRLANVFRSEQAAWRDFCKEGFWEKCDQKKPNSNTNHDDIMLWVSRFVFRAAKTESTAYNRAYKHARTLQRYSREKVPESAVAEKLAEEGADYVFRKEVAENPRRSKTAPCDNGAGADENRAGSRGAGGGSVRKDRSDRASEKLDVPILEVEMTQERLQRVLGLAVGERARVTVECTEADEAWKRIVGKSVKVLD
jgi:hypothetical protein